MMIIITLESLYQIQTTDNTHTHTHKLDTLYMYLLDYNVFLKVATCNIKAILLQSAFVAIDIVTGSLLFGIFM